MSSNFLVFHTFGGISSRPATFLFLIFVSITSSSPWVNCLSLMSCWILIIFMIGLSVTLGDFPSRLVKCSFHTCIRSSGLAAFSLALEVLLYVYRSLSLSLFLSFFLSLSLSLSIYIYIYIYIFVSLSLFFIYICIYIYMYVCVCVCVNIYLSKTFQKLINLSLLKKIYFEIRNVLFKTIILHLCMFIFILFMSIFAFFKHLISHLSIYLWWSKV